jgi:hypothetical protein
VLAAELDRLVEVGALPAQASQQASRSLREPLG